MCVRRSIIYNRTVFLFSFFLGLLEASIDSLEHDRLNWELECASFSGLCPAFQHFSNLNSQIRKAIRKLETCVKIEVSKNQNNGFKIVAFNKAIEQRR